MLFRGYLVWFPYNHTLFRKKTKLGCYFDEITQIDVLCHTSFRCETTMIYGSTRRRAERLSLDLCSISNGLWLDIINEFCVFIQKFWRGYRKYKTRWITTIFNYIQIMVYGNFCLYLVRLKVCKQYNATAQSKWLIEIKSTCLHLQWLISEWKVWQSSKL